MKKKVAALFLTLSTLLCLVGCNEKSAVDFLNESTTTTLYYKLGEDNDSRNGGIHIEYPSLFTKRDTENGYEYVSENEEYVYRFTSSNKNDYPILTYVYTSYERENDAASLFGIRIGTPIFVKKCEALEIEEDRTLFDFLEENGFEQNDELAYKESYWQTVNEQPCLWFCYEKDSVELNVLIGQTGNSELRAYEMIVKE